MTRFPERRKYPNLPSPLRFLFIELSELSEKQAYLIATVITAAAWVAVAVSLWGLRGVE